MPISANRLASGPHHLDGGGELGERSPVLANSALWDKQLLLVLDN